MNAVTHSQPYCGGGEVVQTAQRLADAEQIDLREAYALIAAHGTADAVRREFRRKRVRPCRCPASQSTPTCIDKPDLPVTAQCPPEDHRGQCHGWVACTQGG